MKRLVNRIIVAAIISILGIIGFAAPSFAFGQSGGAGGGGGGNGGTTNPPSSGTPVSGGNTGGGSGSGGTQVPSNIITKRFMPERAIGVGSCGVRDDGKSALGADELYRVEYSENYSGPGAYEAGTGWEYLYATPNGTYMFQRITYIDSICLWPSRTVQQVQPCVIDANVAVDMVKPDATRLGSGSASSGWTAGSTDYQACIDSNAWVGVDIPIAQFGFFSSPMVITKQNVVVEIAITPNDADGTMDAPKIVGFSPVYQTRKTITGSLDCMNGWQEPGELLDDYSFTRCKSPISNEAVCKPSDPIYIPFSKQSGVQSFSGNRFQMLRDGNPARLQFNQQVNAQGITVNSYQTRFERSGTPWDASLSSRDNIFNLYANPKDTKSMFTTPTHSDWMSGKKNDVYPSAYWAGDIDSPTVLTQVLHWKGTVEFTSVAITGIDPVNGTILTTPRTYTIPTEGTCRSTAQIEFVRAIGSISGQPSMFDGSDKIG